MYMSKDAIEFRPGDLVSSVGYDDFTRHSAGLGIIAEISQLDEWPVVVGGILQMAGLLSGKKSLKR